MISYKLTYKAFGNRAIIIEWPAKIDKNILKNVILFKNSILKNNTKVIVEVINTYNSLTIIYQSTIENIYTEILALKSIYKSDFPQTHIKNYRWGIPVCYDKKFGIDLSEISQKNGLEIDAIIKLHSSPIYTVFFVGFLPGFLYLGGLENQLNLDRKSNPRLTVKKGSVGIAGSQTGIYPMASSGGWNIIGNSPISFFNLKNKNPCFAKSGDEIQFYRISIKEHQQIKTQEEIGFYQIEKKLIL